MPEPTNPRGRGRQDPATGLYEWYDLEYEVIRTTGDKLQAVLNGLAPEQELVSAHFQGGRDWTVISRRARPKLVRQALDHLDQMLTYGSSGTLAQGGPVPPGLNYVSAAGPETVYKP